MLFKGERKNGTTGVIDAARALPWVDKIRKAEPERVDMSSDELDLQGWTVQDAKGRKVGDVEGLVVDTSTMKIRFVDIAPDKSRKRKKKNRFVRVQSSHVTERSRGGLGKLLLAGVAIGVASLIARQVTRP
jgi:sporulation protein YlmC with PRC-barrel domain